MNEGDNLMYFARKEQCLALGTQLRAFKPRIEDFKIYRIFPGGDIEFLHPKDGVFPEKVNEGRVFLGTRTSMDLLAKEPGMDVPIPLC